MKNIILIILTFFTLNLFGQTEPRDEFRTATGIVKSVKGTNFKKSIKVIGGKNVTVYEQPNTDTYNTFSIVNDSVRIQKWKLDTATNVFVTSNLNDVYLDNLVNKPSVDSRVVLDMVNDSLKVEVWDIINNTLLSTYYIDNVGNHLETVTTLTNTIPNGNLIGTYTNEAGAVVNIKETLTAYNDQTTSTPHLIGKYLDEFGNLTDINETLTSLNSTLSTGHLIGQYINEDNVGVTIKESIIGVVNNADGSTTITKENGTTVTTTPFHNTNFVQTNDSLWIHTNLDGTKDTIKVPLPTVNTDTRLQLSVVNDSIKIEVVDILTNTVTSTSYLDNMVNQPEIITTITDTLVGGHLIANYTNEANAIRGIYESIIQVDSITNGYVITKEDGTKDTIKINSTGFYTLTDISDTLALSAVAASKCPALTIAKLDSCGSTSLLFYDCKIPSWLTFKIGKKVAVDTTPITYIPSETGNTSNLGNFVRSDNTVSIKEINAGRFIDNCGTALELSEYKNTEFFVTRKYTKELDNTNVASVSNPAYARQLHRARMGDDHAPFPYPDDAYNWVKSKGLVQATINMSDDTFKLSAYTASYYPDGKLATSGSGSFFNDISASTIKKFTVNQPNGTMMFNSSAGMLFDYSSGTTNPIDISFNLDKVIFEGGYGIVSAYPGNGDYSVFKSINFRAKSIIAVTNGYSSIDVKNSIGNIDIDNVTLNAKQADIVGFTYYNTKEPYSARVKVSNIIAGSRMFTSEHSFTLDCNAAKNINLSFDVGNYYKKDSTDDHRVFNITNQGDLDSSNLNYHIENVRVIGTRVHSTVFKSFNPYGNQTFNSKILCDFDNIKIDSGYIYSIGSQTSSSTINSYTNCIITFNIKQADITRGGLGLVKGMSLINSKLIINCLDCTTGNKGLVFDNMSMDATSSIILKGKFKQTHPTNPLVDFTSSVTTPKIILDGTFITGGGYSIDSVNPVNIIVKPGCASNVTTSANVTQLGTGIYVDPNFNN